MNKKNCKSKCNLCKKDILVFRASLKNKRNFCSDECENKWRSEHWKYFHKNKIGFGFAKGHKIGVGNKYAIGNHPKSEWKVGNIPWNKDVPCSQITKDKISKTKKSKFKIPREIRFCVCGCGFFKEVKVNSTWKYKNGHHMKGKSPWNKGTIGLMKANKGSFKKGEHRSPNTEFTLDRLKQMLKEGKFDIKPNNSETVLINLLNTLLPNEYKYVGNYKFWIENFNPDFINCNGQKKIIEIYGYHHTLENRKKRDIRRLGTYDKYGYKTLVIWNSELRNIIKLSNKLMEFNNV